VEINKTKISFQGDGGDGEKEKKFNYLKITRTENGKEKSWRKIT
jgi:hypothetical protein